MTTRPYRNHTTEDIQAFTTLYRAGLSTGKIAKEIGISINTLRKWAVAYIPAAERHPVGRPRKM